VLVGRIAKKAVILYSLGVDIQVLAHESIHMRGERDEGVTDCAAVRAVPGFLIARWGFRAGTRAYREVLRGARDRSDMPPEYRTVC
jgi:hypothetical protein